MTKLAQTQNVMHVEIRFSLSRMLWESCLEHLGFTNPSGKAVMVKVKQDRSSTLVQVHHGGKQICQAPIP